MQSFILRHKPQLTIISGVLIAAGLVARFAFHSQPAYAAALTRQFDRGAEAQRQRRVSYRSDHPAPQPPHPPAWTTPKHS